MKDKTKAILFMIICSFLASAAQIMYKIGAIRLEFNVLSMITNWPIILGLVLYALALVFMIIAYRHAELTLLYPIIATTYIWVMLLAAIIFPDETITLTKGLGVLLIVLGVLSTGIGSK